MKQRFRTILQLSVVMMFLTAVLVPSSHIMHASSMTHEMEMSEMQLELADDSDVQPMDCFKHCLQNGTLGSSTSLAVQVQEDDIEPSMSSISVIDEFDDFSSTIPPPLDLSDSCTEAILCTQKRE